MKLNVQGIEEIEITDPAGLCNPPAPQPPMPSNPMPAILPGLPSRPNPFSPQPMVPTPFGDPRINPVVPRRDPGWTRAVHEPEKWGVGGEAIQQAGEQVDPDKWQKNWQASMGEKGKGDGDGSNH